MTKNPIVLDDNDQMSFAQVAKELGVSQRTAANFALCGYFVEDIGHKKFRVFSLSPKAVEDAKVRYATEIAARQTLCRRIKKALRR